MMFRWENAIGFIGGSADVRTADIDSDDKAHTRNYNRGVRL